MRVGEDVVEDVCNASWMQYGWLEMVRGHHVDKIITGGMIIIFEQINVKITHNRNQYIFLCQVAECHLKIIIKS